MRRIIASLFFLLPISIFGQGEKILSKHLEKYGQSTWSQVQTLKILGKQVSEDYTAYPITIFNNENKQISVVAQGRGLSYSLTLDHQVFWTVGESNTPRPLEKLMLLHAITIGSPLAKFQNEIKYSGLEVLDGSTFHSFKMKQEESSIHYLLDKDTDELRHILLKNEGNEPMAARLTFDKYKSHHGLLMPTAMVIEVEDQFKEWVFDEILLGISIDEKIFIKPNSQ